MTLPSFRVPTWVLALLALPLLLTIPHLVIEPEPNLCQMTYMNPHYAEVPVPPSDGVSFPPRYRLFLYNDKQWAGGEPRAAFRKAISVSRAAVLFVPGNLGSYRQVRSLGKALDAHATNVVPRGPKDAEPPQVPVGGRLAVFAVDFGEELSGLSGALLERESAFVEACARFLATEFTSQKLRPRRAKDLLGRLVGDQGKKRAKGKRGGGDGGTVASVDPTRAADLFLEDGLSLVGHSMGGVVAARASLSLGTRSVVTVSTPHAIPPVGVDSRSLRFYRAVSAGWSARANDGGGGGENRNDDGNDRHGGVLSNGGDGRGPYVLASVHGGRRDELIRPALGIPGFQTGPGSSVFSVLGNAIGGAWVSADHRCSMWCRQLVDAYAEALTAWRDTTPSFVGYARAAAGLETRETATTTAAEAIRTRLEPRPVPFSGLSPKTAPVAVVPAKKSGEGGNNIIGSEKDNVVGDGGALGTAVVDFDGDGRGSVTLAAGGSQSEAVTAFTDGLCDVVVRAEGPRGVDRVLYSHDDPKAWSDVPGGFSWLRAPVGASNAGAMKIGFECTEGTFLRARVHRAHDDVIADSSFAPSSIFGAPEFEVPATPRVIRNPNPDGMDPLSDLSLGRFPRSPTFSATHRLRRHVDHTTAIDVSVVTSDAEKCHGTRMPVTVVIHSSQRYGKGPLSRKGPESTSDVIFLQNVLPPLRAGAQSNSKAPGEGREPGIRAHAAVVQRGKPQPGHLTTPHPHGLDITLLADPQCLSTLSLSLRSTASFPSVFQWFLGFITSGSLTGGSESFSPGTRTAAAVVRDSVVDGTGFAVGVAVGAGSIAWAKGRADIASAVTVAFVVLVSDNLFGTSIGFGVSLVAAGAFSLLVVLVSFLGKLLLSLAPLLPQSVRHPRFYRCSPSPRCAFVLALFLPIPAFAIVVTALAVHAADTRKNGDTDSGRPGSDANGAENGALDDESASASASASQGRNIPFYSPAGKVAPELLAASVTTVFIPVLVLSLAGPLSESSRDGGGSIPPIVYDLLSAPFFSSPSGEWWSRFLCALGASLLASGVPRSAAHQQFPSKLLAQRLGLTAERVVALGPVVRFFSAALVASVAAGIVAFGPFVAPIALLPIAIGLAMDAIAARGTHQRTE